MSENHEKNENKAEDKIEVVTNETTVAQEQGRERPLRMPAAETVKADPVLVKMYADFLGQFSIHFLRNIARYLGVVRPASKKKDALISDMVAVLTGEAQPGEPSGRGAPVKENYLDPTILDGLNRVRDEYVLFQERKKHPDMSEENILALASGNGTFGLGFKSCVGTLEILATGNAFIRRQITCAPSADDIYLSAHQVNEWALDEGDTVVCTYSDRTNDSYATLRAVISVCGVERGNYERRKFFSSFQVESPRVRLKASSNPLGDELWYVAPLGRGQRVLVHGATYYGRRDFLTRLTLELKKNNMEDKVYALFMDGTPEDNAELQNTIGADCAAVSFDETPQRKIFIADMLIKKCKRFAELGGSAILVVNSLTALARASMESNEAANQTVTDALSFAGLTYVRKFFASARNLQDGGSITIIAGIDTDTNTARALEQELKGTPTSEIFLLDEKVGLQHKPDLARSYTKRDDLLLTDEERLRALDIRTRFKASRPTEDVPEV